MKHVAVLMGGWSAEREVSINSGLACTEALKKSGYRVTPVDAGRNIAQTLAEIRPDVCFNALHGRYGEDGYIQGVLEIMGIPYTHSGVLASALAMDKPVAKTLFKAAGIPVADGRIFTRREIQDGARYDKPFVVKPLNEGSSVGVTIILDGENMMPAPLDPADYEEALRLALLAHRTLGCRGVSRSDLRFDDTGEGRGKFYMLETNTQPGMTSLSLVPEIAGHCGISFEELVCWIVEDASCDR